jgi:Kdo2-lipid IVA lauroyltransferase/acyltransferase
VNVLLKAWYLIEYGAAKTLLFFVGTAPLPLVLGVAELAARMSFFLWRSRRQTAIANLLSAGICADEPAARRLALESFRAFTGMVAESIVARRRLTPENWSRYVQLHLTPEAESLLKKPGLGVLAASAHIGNWEVAARAVSMIKPMCVVYRPFNNPYLDRVAHANRSGEHLRLVSRIEQEPMRFIQALARGEIVALMIDQHVSKGRVAVQFFGRPAWTTKTVAMLHLTTRAPLLIAFALRTGPLRYEVHAIGPIERERTGDREKDTLELTQVLTDEIEKIARKHPEQYMWGHRRWKGHPDN